MTNGSGPAFGERVEYGPDDVCYRHADRHSFTLCQRCGRTICADCQNVSAVGVLCPECVRQTRPGAAKRSARTARVAGRRFAGSDAPVTYGIMIACAAVFLAQLATHYFGADQVTRALWYAPLYSLPDAVLPPGLAFEPWRMATAMFAHSTGFILHILFNMYALWLFGRNLEQMIGRTAFVLLYLFAGLGGSLAVMFWVYADPTSINVPTVGASGAIFGVLAATLVAYRAARVNITSLAVLIAINFGIGLLPGAGISWQAHLGGAIAGAATMGLLLATRGPRRRGARIAVLAGLGVLLVLLAGAYFVWLPAGV
ncbi:rhomboid family intramembrane serine protease [Leucobacter allii]|uniref:Rhomboid family intramembrane serine protease n=1 Tax=Leucobacter allii TaxID=2932247 RepID=A0ABY4FL99_9MICO|nr:rhomboid family intramembrane serine protease [Leucobacter allii]UOQ57043.1 rhomboid family intramembrane serine protease [Leucobacter allii]UOR01555.1 rhomboid family intramembrane serine protease [Leucobacter allii]